MRSIYRDYSYCYCYHKRASVTRHLVARNLKVTPQNNHNAGSTQHIKKCPFCILFFRFIIRPCQHDDGYIDGRSQIKVHTDERTQVRSTWSSLTVTHSSTNRGRCCLTSVNVPLSSHRKPAFKRQDTMRVKSLVFNLSLNTGARRS